MRDHNVPFYSLTHMIDQALIPRWKVRLRALWGHFLAASVVERGQTEGVLPSKAVFGDSFTTKEGRPKRSGLRSNRSNSLGAACAAGTSDRRRLAAGLALLHKGILGRAGELLSVRTHRLGFTAVVHALLHEGGFGGARQRLAVLAHRLGLATFLRQRRATGKGNDDGRQCNFSKHVFLSEIGCKSDDLIPERCSRQGKTGPALKRSCGG